MRLSRGRSEWQKLCPRNSPPPLRVVFQKQVTEGGAFKGTCRDASAHERLVMRLAVRRAVVTHAEPIPLIYELIRVIPCLSSRHQTKKKSPIMDSGSAECVASESIAKGVPLMETEASRQGQTYHTEDEGVIKNKGEKTVTMYTEAGDLYQAQHHITHVT